MIAQCFGRRRLMCRLAFSIALLGTALGAAAQTAKLDDAWFYPDRPAELKSHEGKPTPDLKFKEWIGDKVEMSQTRGKVVVIDFWATWCPPCMAAIPKNVEMVKKYKDQGLVFVGIHDANNGWDSAANVVRDKGINYPVAKDADGGPSAKAFDLAFWPTYVVIDRKGVVRGSGLMPHQVENAVKLLLAEPAPEGTAGGAAPGSRLGPEWYNGGNNRPLSLKAMEGKPMPALAASQWFGAEVTPADLKDRVVVVHFVSSGNALSMRQGEVLAALEQEMGAQGVTIITVCPPEDAWETMSKAATDHKLPSRLCQDTAAAKPRPSGLGATAEVFGVRFVPATIVIDRAGVIRAAGIKADRVKALAGKLLAEPVKPQGG
ncbi:MAG: redoxin family protein [Phycisphaerales bacterium]